MQGRYCRSAHTVANQIGKKQACSATPCTLCKLSMRCLALVQRVTLSGKDNELSNQRERITVYMIGGCHRCLGLLLQCISVNRAVEDMVV